MLSDLAAAALAQSTYAYAPHPPPTGLHYAPVRLDATALGPRREPSNRHEPAMLDKLEGAELTQGVEIISWLVARGALDEQVAKVHSHYHVPVTRPPG